MDGMRMANNLQMALFAGAMVVTSSAVELPRMSTTPEGKSLVDSLDAEMKNYYAENLLA